MIVEQEVMRQIRAALTELGRKHDITMETHIHQDLDFDSISALDFIMVLETRLDTVVSMDFMADIQTIGDLVRTIVEHTAKQPAGAN